MEQTLRSGQLLSVVELWFITFNVFWHYDGRIFRLDDPRNSAAAATPVNITPTVTDMSGLNVQDIAVNPNNDNEIIAVVTNYGRTVGANLNNVTNILWTNDAKSASPTWKVAEGILRE
jgi:hypothetical protein